MEQHVDQQLEQQSQIELLIAQGREQGYLILSEVHDHLPEELVDAEQIEDIIQMITDMGIKVLETAPDTDELMLAENITYFGEAGKGQYTKLANQIAIATTMISVAESFKFAKEVGLDLDSFFKTVSTGSGGSFSMTSYGPRILNEDFKPGFFTHHFIKDMKLALEECEKMDIKLPGLETAYKIYNELEEEVRNTNGTQAISKWYKL